MTRLTFETYCFMDSVFKKQVLECGTIIFRRFALEIAQSAFHGLNSALFEGFEMLETDVLLLGVEEASGR